MILINGLLNTLHKNFIFRIFLSSLIIGLTYQSPASAEQETIAKTLGEKYTALSSQLANNAFRRPLVMQSVESSKDLKGEIYGVIDYPFATVNKALNNAENWCDVLILHVNIKYCQAKINKNTTTLSMYLGKKDPQLLTDAYHVDFNYNHIASNMDYFSTELNAEKGPLGTYDYHIAIEAVPLKNGRTFLHFTYAYRFGLAGKLAMKGYLATAGKDKIGFSLEPSRNDHPTFIKGVRGVIERNTMRYYLAIDSYLSALNMKDEGQFDARLQHWYDATEQYVPQLHEIERADYIAMKSAEYARQRSNN